MKQYRILKSFTGSQDGITSSEFVADTIRGISDHLASAVAGTGWIEEVTEGVTPVVREAKVLPPVATKVVVPTDVKTPNKATQAEIDAMDFKALKVEAKKRGIKLFGLSEAKLRLLLAE